MDRINVTIIGEDSKELSEKLSAVITMMEGSGFKGSYEANVYLHPRYDGFPMGLGQKPAETTSEELKKEKKRGRPAKTETVESVTLDSPELPSAVHSVVTVEETPAPAKTATKEEAAGRLQKLVETLGVPKAKEILAKYNAKKISEVKEADYGSLVSYCDEAMAGK